jgi:hypothetical protein
MNCRICGNAFFTGESVSNVIHLRAASLESDPCQAGTIVHTNCADNGGGVACGCPANDCGNISDMFTFAEKA